MPIPLYINYREPTHGVNSGGYQDVSNRPARTIWSNFLNQHNKDGSHKSDLLDPGTWQSGMWQMETDTYTGDGNDDRTITLNNAALDVKFVRIFSADYAYTWYALEDVDTYAITTEGYSSQDHIQTMGIGSFQIGAAPEVNNLNTVFFYTVYGILTT